MYDINLKNVKKGKNFYLIFLFVGLFVLILFSVIFLKPYYYYFSYKGKTTAVDCETFERHDSDGTMYSPSYTYVVDDNIYKCKTDYSSAAKPNENGVVVKYDLDNPSNCVTSYETFNNWWLLLLLLLPIIFILVAVINMNKVNKRVKKIQDLNNNGVLVKGLKYKLVDSGMVVNNVPIKTPAVDYTLPSGSVVTLYGDPRHDKKAFDSDGLVDLVIDPNNPENYFIDFEINRLSGNLTTDYYKSNDNQNDKEQ